MKMNKQDTFSFAEMMAKHVLKSGLWSLRGLGLSFDSPSKRLLMKPCKSDDSRRIKATLSLLTVTTSLFVTHWLDSTTNALLINLLLLTQPNNFPLFPEFISEVWGFVVRRYYRYGHTKVCEVSVLFSYFLMNVKKSALSARESSCWRKTDRLTDSNWKTTAVQMTSNGFFIRFYI